MFATKSPGLRSRGKRRAEQPFQIAMIVAGLQTISIATGFYGWLNSAPFSTLGGKISEVREFSNALRNFCASLRQLAGGLPHANHRNQGYRLAGAAGCQT
jgi:hypothetical protein